MAAQCKDGQVGGCFIPGMSVFPDVDLSSAEV